MKQNGWAVTGICGLYVDWRLTRRDMIEHHCSTIGREWPECRKKGDRCIKVKISSGWHKPIRQKKIVIKKTKTNTQRV